MKRALLYNPDNDLALASGAPHYSPPAPVARFCRECALLSAWVAEPGDTVVAPGVATADLEWLGERFGLHVSANEAGPEFIPTPWGWSRSVAGEFRRLGYSHIPDPDTLDRLRRLSHRATAIACRRFVGAEPGVTAASLEQIRSFLKAHGGAAYAKSPWSCSGRGVMRVTVANFPALSDSLRGIVRRQGCVALEPAYSHRLDCAALFRLRDGQARLEGWSLFLADPTGRYGGNLVASQQRLLELIHGALARPDDLEQAALKVADFLTAEVAPSYSGPVGVDMLIDRQGELHPCIEINLRATMGFVAKAVWSRLGREGVITTTPGASGMPLLPGGRLRLEPFNPDICYSK